MAAGYELLWGVEYDPAIAAVTNANLPHRDQVYAESVVGFDWAKVARPDHLHMSPPCQDFSVAKKTGTVSNDNDALAEACISAIRTLEPATVTLENVEGYRKAPGFQAIVDTLYSLGYWVDWQVLNSADMGVPQTRRRLFLRAARGMFLPPLPAPVPWVGWYQAIEDLIPTLPETKFAQWQLERLPSELKDCWLPPTDTGGNQPVPISEPAMTIRTNDYGRRKAYLIESKNANQQYGDGVRESHQPHTTVITDHKPSHQPKVYLVDSANKGKNYQRDKDKPSGTVETFHKSAFPRAITPSGRVVRMTPRALARFQTVPDDYALPEKNTLACKVIGNGIPCLMMQRVMESFNG
jgi:DNA (cytosine-5)-methyltransferase 1